MNPSTVTGLSDDHVHSCLGSFDARATVNALCARAVACGLRSLCITEHLDYDRSLPEYGFFVFDTVRQAIDDARECYGAQLDIRMGLEVDFSPASLPAILDTGARYPVDYLLGAVHTYQGKHFSWFRAEGCLEHSAEELGRMYADYFAQTRQMIRTGVVDCIAHLDYPAKAGIRASLDAPIPGYAEELEETLALAVAHGIGLEVNTKRCRVGAPTAASTDAVRRYVALGGRRLALGSDAHNVEQLADGLEIGRALLLQVGIAEQTVFRQRRAEGIALVEELIHADCDHRGHGDL